MVTGVRAERRRRRGADEVRWGPVGVQRGGLGWHGVHVVQAGIRALLLGSQTKPLGLRLQGLLLAYRVAVVEGRLWPLLLFLRLFQLLAQLVLGCRLGGLAR